LSPGPSTSQGTGKSPKGFFASAEFPVLLTVVLGTMLAPLNSTMIVVALPQVMDHFNTGLSAAGWLVTGYLIGMASLQPVAGKIGDRIGRRMLVLGGLVLFGMVSVGASLAPNLWVLLIFRILQSVAGALIIPNGAALIREVIPEARRGQSFGLMGSGIGLAAALGPPLGGLVSELAGWRSIFLLNLLVVIPAVVIGFKCLPRPEASTSKGRVDILGIVMLPVVLTCLVVLITAPSKNVPAQVIVPAAVGVAVLAIFFLWLEYRHPSPIFQPRLFRNRAFTAANAGVCFSNLSMYTILISVPLLLAARSGSTSFSAGVILGSMSVAMIVISPLGGRLADKFGRRLPALVGMGLLVAGVIPMALTGPAIGVPVLVAGLATIGIGLGISGAGLQTTSVESVSREDTGLASGMYSTSRYLGSIVGSAILAGLLGANRSNLDGLSTLFWVVLASAILALAVSLGLKPFPRTQPGRQST
jgi:EmrB/QacA subfamily drug resistance transporter